jgi:hypothetical protein
MDFFDPFEHTGENGKYIDLVLEVMWTNLHGFIARYSDDAQMRMATVGTIVPQVLQGLQIIQACGIIHNGNNAF